MAEMTRDQMREAGIAAGIPADVVDKMLGRGLRPLPPVLSAMCECSHPWDVHRESGQTGPDAICHGYIGSATPGPLYDPCRCLGFKAWSGPRDARTGEPVKPLTMVADARREPDPMPARLADPAKMCADLEGYIERRAAELARPVIEEAERSAVTFEQRAADLREEFGRMVRHLESQLASARRRLEAARAESRQNAEIAAAAIDRADALERQLREVPADGS